MTKQTLFSSASLTAHLKKVLLGTVALAVIAAVSAPVLAQDSVLLEEVIVTAQKREQSVQDVGIAITAITGEQMRALGYTNAQEVTALAPGVSTLQPNGEANYSIGIRGVANNDFTTNVESPIAIYVDEVYISQMSGAGFLLFDMERVEILRGPQGTLFGRNATGGLVQYITVKPSNELSGYGSVTYGRFNRVKAQGAFNLPLSDTVSARLSIATHQGDGYVTNRLKPGSELNNANELAIRAQVLFNPSDSTSILLNARHGSQDIRTGFFEFASAVFPDGEYTPGLTVPELDHYEDTDGDIYAGDYDFEGHNDLETEGLTATINWSNDSIKLTSITDYQTVIRDYIEDSDATPVDYFDFFLTTDAEQFSQELRLSGETDKLKWVTGVYYLDLDIQDSNGGIMRRLFEELFGLPVEVLGVNGMRNPYRTQTESWSLFGQGEYAVSEQLSVIAGFRWINEDKIHEYSNFVSWFPDTTISGQDPNIVDIVVDEASGGLDPYFGTRDDSEWSARLQVDYRPNDDTLLYASWNRGVKSGGFNAPLLPSFLSDDGIKILPDGTLEPFSFMNYEPERLDAYEAGFKADLSAGRLRVNGAAYYYDYKQCQVFSIIQLDTFTLNGDCESKGFELEVLAAPAAGLDLMFGVGYVDAEATDIPGITLDVIDPLGLSLALRPGDSVPPVQSPKWNLSGLIRYEFPVGNGNVALQGDFQYRSEHFFTLLGTTASTENGYTVFNASVAWFPESDNWSLRFSVHNLTGEEYLVQTFDLSGSVSNGGFFGLVEQYYGRPRTWGINASYYF
ncbi:MAG: TonB-dependent receptor [Proteobacteria bacterium]|nr:TonB-dependent receptor [Pseudomonadota bacterium]